MNPGSDGIIYGATEDSDYFTLSKGKLIDYLDLKFLDLGKVRRIFPDPDSPGKVFVIANDTEIHHGDLKNNPSEPETIDVSPLSNILDIREINGDVWISARNGIGILKDDHIIYLDNLPMNNSVNSVMTDYEGNIWFSSSRQGIMKLVPNRFSDIFKIAGLSSTVVNSTCISRGKLFVGT